MSDGQGVRPEAFSGEPGGVGPEVEGDVPTFDPGNLVVIGNLAFLVLSWVEWEENGFFVLGYVA